LGDNIHIVCYAKIVDDKEDGIKLVGVYFGGAAPDQHGATAIVRDCINNVRGGTILARSWPTTGPGQVPAVLQLATLHYRKIEDQMIHNQEILTRTRK
jgi:hypothetical protein